MPHDEYHAETPTSQVNTIQATSKYLGVPRMGDLDPDEYMCLTDSNRHHLIPPEDAWAFTATATQPIPESTNLREATSPTTPSDDYKSSRAHLHMAEEDSNVQEEPWMELGEPTRQPQAGDDQPQDQQPNVQQPTVVPQTQLEQPPTVVHQVQLEQQQLDDVQHAPQLEEQQPVDVQHVPPRPPRVRFQSPSETPIMDHTSPPHRKEPDKQRRKPDPPPCTSANDSEPPKKAQKCTQHNTQAKNVRASQLECKTWHMRLGHPGPQKLIKTAKCTKGIPLMGNLHPMFDCESCIRSKLTKAPKGKTETFEASKPGERYHMDFGFVRGPKYIASTRRNKLQKRPQQKNPIITSREGFNSYLLITDAYTRVCWIFLLKSKEPPTETIRAFMEIYGRRDNTQRFIRTDQGGELARSTEFRQILLKSGYLLEDTGSDTSSQNGRGERPHQTLSNMMRCLLYNAGLGSAYWADALVYSVYLYNRLYHDTIMMTPYEKWSEEQPDVSHIKVFGSLVNSRNPGFRKSKAGDHTSTGIFLRFTGTSKNIVYLDTETRQEKRARHIHPDEYHYSTAPANRPSIHQQLITKYADIDHPTANPTSGNTSNTVLQTKFNPGLLEDIPTDIAAAASLQTNQLLDEDLPPIPDHIIQTMLNETTLPIVTSIEEPMTPKANDPDILSIHLSLDVYGPSITETIDIHPTHPTLGFDLHYNNRSEAPIIKACHSGTPAAKIQKWRSRL